MLKHLGALLTLVFLEFVKLNSLKEVIISRCCRIYLILLTPPVRFNTLVIYIAYCDYHFKNIIAIKKWKKKCFFDVKFTTKLQQQPAYDTFSVKFLQIALIWDVCVATYINNKIWCFSFYFPKIQIIFGNFIFCNN